MEYTFRNAFSEAPCLLRLHDSAMSCEVNGHETVIPYSSILEVKLVRQNARMYKTIVIAAGKKPILITNKYYTADSVYEDRSRAYSTFVRVLHFHLKDKSKAVFTSGKRFSNMWFWMAVSVFLSFIISYFTHYLGLGLANPVVQGVVLAVLMSVFVVALNMSNWQRHYQPTDIPLEFLP